MEQKGEGEPQRNYHARCSGEASEGGFVLEDFLVPKMSRRAQGAPAKAGKAAKRVERGAPTIPWFSTSDRAPKRTATNPNAMPNVDKRFRGYFQSATSLNEASPTFESSALTVQT